jgi:hypothetical protein
VHRVSRQVKENLERNISIAIHPNTEVESLELYKEPYRDNHILIVHRVENLFKSEKLEIILPIDKV